jgi:hypothetical protein
VLDPETLKPAREPISLKECAPHAMAVISLGGELFVADDTYWVGHRRSEQEKQAHTRVVVISEAGELKRNMPLPTGHRYSGFRSLTALRSDKLLAVTSRQLVVMSTQGEALQVSRRVSDGPRISHQHLATNPPSAPGPQAASLFDPIRR